MDGVASIDLDIADLSAEREAALREGVRLVDYLAQRRNLSLDQVLHQLGELWGLPMASWDQLERWSTDFTSVSLADAKRRGIIPLRSNDGRFAVAGPDPLDPDTYAFLEYWVSEPITLMLAHPEDVARRLALAEAEVNALDGVSVNGDPVLKELGRGEDLSIEGIQDATSPIVQLVNATLHDAIKANASDVHLETAPDGLRVKYRLDGVLVEIRRVPGIEAAERTLSRLKVLSELDIAEKRVPQDGRFRGRIGSTDIDFRISVMPSVYGEDAVVRILDKRSLADEVTGLTLERLGFETEIIERVRDLAALPYGMLLVTGPTGSGKTTTLYALLSETFRSQDKIITIEDPVEYQLNGVLQIPVNERKGLTFARGLRSILRHDPDRIMVGEIRDTETAEISIQAALTGHLVYTTVHANNVLDVLGRFLHMGVDTYNFVSAVNGVLAQRLVRKVCEHCVEGAVPEPNVLRRSNVPESYVKTAKLVRGRGCDRCRGTGYHGRRAIAELLTMTDDMREAIVARQSTRTLRTRAAAQGTRSLRDAALSLVARGVTTLEEANRVTFAVE